MRVNIDSVRFCSVLDSGEATNRQTLATAGAGPARPVLLGLGFDFGSARFKNAPARLELRALAPEAGEHAAATRRPRGQQPALRAAPPFWFGVNWWKLNERYDAAMPRPPVGVGLKTRQYGGLIPAVVCDDRVVCRKEDVAPRRIVWTAPRCWRGWLPLELLVLLLCREIVIRVSFPAHFLQEMRHCLKISNSRNAPLWFGLGL